MTTNRFRATLLIGAAIILLLAVALPLTNAAAQDPLSEDLSALPLEPTPTPALESPRIETESMSLTTSLETTATDRGFIVAGFTAHFYDGAHLTSYLFSRPYAEPIDFYRACWDEVWPYPGCKLIEEQPDGGDYSISWEGVLLVPADGEYTFTAANVDDGVSLFLDGMYVMDQGWNWPSPDQRPSPQTLSLTAGRHEFAVHYEQRVFYVASLQLRWSGPGFAEEVIPVTTQTAPVVNADPMAQAVQYSDRIEDVTVLASDVAADDLSATTKWSVNGADFTPGLPGDLSLTDDGCTITDNTKLCAWTLEGPMSEPEGTYTVRVTATDDDGAYADADVTITVLPEDATVAFGPDNPVAVQVAEPGENSGPFVLTVYVSESPSDVAAHKAQPGYINLAEVSMSLVPVGPGGSVLGTCTPGPVTGDGYGVTLSVTCSFDSVEVNAYTVQATVGGGYFAGYGEDVLVVSDPSLGFATGGGWFYWPDTDERTNFGFTMKYNKKGQKVKGNLVLIRHAPGGSIYRVKSNALYGLALGENPVENYGWASFSGKSTYLEPGWPEPIGNYEFLVYVEDNNEPGAGVDRFWLEVKDKDRMVVPVMSMDREATDNAVELQGGNVAVPHVTGGNP